MNVNGKVTESSSRFGRTETENGTFQAECKDCAVLSDTRRSFITSIMSMDLFRNYCGHRTAWGFRPCLLGIHPPGCIQCLHAYVVVATRRNHNQYSDQILTLQFELDCWVLVQTCWSHLKQCLSLNINRKIYMYILRWKQQQLHPQPRLSFN